jgi:excisionase family DNA binding protein
MTLDKDIITVTEAAKLCNVTRATIWRWIKSGLLNAGATAGGHHRINRKDLAELIQFKNMKSRCRDDAGNYRILVVDDDPKVQKVLGLRLNKKGYEMDYASDGFEAGLKTIRFKPHLIILDLFMPKMDGFEVCQQLKLNDDTKDIKIIAISGLESEENKKRILGFGADLFLGKDLDFKVLVKEISDLLTK